MGSNQTGGFLPHSTIECIRSWLTWQTTPEDNVRMEKIVPRGLITSGPFDSVGRPCKGSWSKLHPGLGWFPIAGQEV